MLSALQVKAFRRLAVLYPVDGLLEWGSSIALMVLVYDHTGSALATGALLVCKQVVPGLLTPLAGRQLNAAPIGVAIAIAMLVRAVAVAGAAATGYGAPIFVLALVAGLGGTLSRAAFRTGVARTLRGEQRRAGNALLNMAMGLVSLVGPAATGLALTVVPAAYLLQVSAVIGVGCAFAALVFGPGQRTWNDQPPGDAHLLPADEAVSPGSVAPAAPLAPSAEPPLPVPVLLILAGVVFTAFAMDEPSLLPYAEQSLGEGVGVYGAILSCWGLGIIIGSVAFSRLLDRPMVAVGAVGTGVAALAYLGLGAAPNANVAFVVAVIGGVGNGFNWVALVTAVQESTPADAQGQAATRLEAIATVGPGIGYLLGGLIADAASPRLTLIIPGVIALVVLAGGTAAAAMQARRREPLLSSAAR